VSFAGIVKVYAIVAGKAEERRVKTGVYRDGRVEVLDGVKVGETIATSGLSQLATGPQSRSKPGPAVARRRERASAAGRARQRTETEGVVDSLAAGVRSLGTAS